MNDKAAKANGADGRDGSSSGRFRYRAKVQAAAARRIAGAPCDLSRLVPLWPWERDATGPEAQLRLLSRLRRALREERRRGLAGHWSYDLARHAQLVDAYRAALQRYLAKAGARREGSPSAGHPDRDDRG